MRTFVTGTGRCGSCTFYQALRHCDNRTIGHESRSGLIAPHDYPDNHIEVSHHLVVAIPQLRAQYPEAKWIYLVREKKQCTASLVENLPVMLSAYTRQWFRCRCNGHPQPPRSADWLVQAAVIYYDQVNALCRALLPDAMTVKLETAADQWLDVWEYLGLDGNFAMSRAEWSRAYNHAKARGIDNYIEVPS